MHADPRMFLCHHVSVCGSIYTLVFVVYFFFQAEDGIRDLVRSRGLGDVYKRQMHHRGDVRGFQRPDHGPVLGVEQHGPLRPLE